MRESTRCHRAHRLVQYLQPLVPLARPPPRALSPHTATDRNLLVTAWAHSRCGISGATNSNLLQPTPTNTVPRISLDLRHGPSHQPGPESRRGPGHSPANATVLVSHSRHPNRHAITPRAPQAQTQVRVRSSLCGAKYPQTATDRQLTVKNSGEGCLQWDKQYRARGERRRPTNSGLATIRRDNDPNLQQSRT